MGDQPVDLGGLPAEPAGPLPSLDLGPPPVRPEPNFFGSAADWLRENTSGVVSLVNALGGAAASAVQAGGVASRTVQNAVGQAQADAIAGAQEGFMRKYGGMLAAAAVFGLVYVSLNRK
jgi:hypothetical protein